MDMRQQTIDKIIEHLTMYGDPVKDTGRWMPVLEFILKRMMIDIKTKTGRQVLNELDIAECLNLNQQHFSDMELLDLLVMTVRRWAVQR
mgnify:CR=1 FL=1|jgi:hypothetical protein